MKKCFLTQKGPKAIGPYCTATIAGNTCYMSGMLGVNPETGKLAEGGIEAQAAQAMKNICAVLGELGLTPAAVLKTTVFLADMADFAAFNGVYAKYFVSKPARSCVAVKEVPKGVLCEIEITAVLPEK